MYHLHQLIVHQVSLAIHPLQHLPQILGFSELVEAARQRSTFSECTTDLKDCCRQEARAVLRVRSAGEACTARASQVSGDALLRHEPVEEH